MGIEENKDGSDGNEGQQQDQTGGLNLTLELTSITDKIAFRKLHLGRHLVTNLFDHTPQIPSCHIALDHDASQSVFSENLVRARTCFDGGHLGQWNAPTGGKIHQNVIQKLQVVPPVMIQTEKNIEAALLLQDLGDDPSIECGLQSLGNLSNPQAVPCRLGPVHLDTHLWNGDLRFNIEIPDPCDTTHNQLNLFRQRAQYGEVFTKNLDRDLGKGP